MKTAGSIAILVAALLGMFYFSMDHQAGVDQIYLLPEGFEGCVIIRYDVEGAAPLVIENEEIVYEVPENGIIETSSAYDFGWVNEKHSGAHDVQAFYVDGKGVIVEELPQENIRFGASGSMQQEGKPEMHYSYQIFGSEKMDERGCEFL